WSTGQAPSAAGAYTLSLNKKGEAALRAANKNYNIQKISGSYSYTINPGDQGDTPTPEPTPEPEPTPTPNPTPDDQPDSETSSDEHFENVKPKDKLDKNNPKKVDAYKKQRKIIKTKIAKQGHTEIAEPIEDKVTRENNVKVVSDPVENMAAEPKLPQTGEADNSIIGLLGMLLASFAAMFGFDSLHSHDKKHKN
ncbi:LPXTG cell wall anchor domain-containing protein, partial [Lactobacillus gallinarum]|uniref:LPXTG cell wall anchor domain-containing protein n=1 Tax=Lactobacillus gallinarum TaxID=52242 RepID=UPI0024B966DC